MAAPYLDLLSKCEAAAKAVVDALALSGVLVNTHLDDEELTLPAVICNAEATGQEVPMRSGNYVVSLRVTVLSQADDTVLTAHRTRVATVFDAFRDSAIATTLSGHVTDFYVFEVNDTRIGRENFKTEEGSAVLGDFIELDILCCAADIS